MKLVLGLSLLSFAVLAGRAEAQVLCTLGSAPAGYESLADMPASASAQADLRKLKAALCPKGCGKVLLFANPTAPNVATVTDGQGTSKITYNPKFLASIQEELGPAGTLGVFAHELGHHLEKTASHPSWMETAWDSELRADAWASCALAKVELRPSAVQAAVRALSTYPAATHPEWEARAAVLRKGYASCGGAKTLPGALEAPGEQIDRRQGRTQDGAQSRPRSAGRRRRVQEQSRVPQRARLRQRSLQRGPGGRSLRERHRLPGTARVQRERALRKAERRGSCRDPARGGTGTAAGATPGCRPRRPQRFSGPRRARGRAGPQRGLPARVRHGPCPLRRDRRPRDEPVHRAPCSRKRATGPAPARTIPTATTPATASAAPRTSTPNPVRRPIKRGTAGSKAIAADPAAADGHAHADVTPGRPTCQAGPGRVNPIG